jgi:hypothetical protein
LLLFAALVFGVLDGRIARWRPKHSGPGTSGHLCRQILDHMSEVLEALVE